MYLCMYLSICLSVWLSTCMFVFLTGCLCETFSQFGSWILKTSIFFETSFKFDSCKLLQANLDLTVPPRFAFFTSMSLHLPREMNSTKYDVSNTEIAPLPQNWCLEPPTSWPKMQKCCACHETCNTSNCLQIHHACPSFAHCRKTHKFSSLLTKYTIPCACLEKRRLNVRKCSETVSFLHFRRRNHKNTSHFGAFWKLNVQKCPENDSF